MTFADLGIPFPLWEAPINSASSYAGEKTCSLCHTENRHCFGLSGGDVVMVVCPACQTENGLSKYGKEDGAVCIKCGGLLDFPLGMVEGTDNKPALVCYDCLRAGRVALPKDTVQDGEMAGLLDWENAAKNTAAPGLMWELLRTPHYVTWQGEKWQFDEGKPMIYVGEWSQADFNQNAPDGNGETFYKEINGDAQEDDWRYVGNFLCVYVFRNATRQKWAAHSDTD